MPPVEAPRRQRPIVLIGAGGIVKDAHLPAYGARRFRGRRDSARSWTEAKPRPWPADSAIPRVFRTLAKALAAAPAGAVFDVAVPATALAEVLDALPDGASDPDAEAVRGKPRPSPVLAGPVPAQGPPGGGFNFQLRATPPAFSRLSA